VRDAALALPRYLLLFAVVLAVLVLFVALPAVSESGWSISTILGTVRSAWLPAIVVSLFASSFFAPPQIGARLLSVVFLILLSGALLVFGTMLTAQLCTDCESDDIPFPFRDGEVQILRRGALFTAAVDDQSAEVTGLVHFAPPEQEIVGAPIEHTGPLTVTYYREASYYPETDLLNATGEPIPVSPEDPVVSPMVEPPPLVRSLVEDVKSLNSYLNSLREQTLEFFALTCLAVCAFAVSCLSFAHMSRWKLLNFCLTVLMFRLLFLLFDLFVGDFISSLLAGFDAPIFQYLPMLVFSVLAVLFLAMDLLFPRGEA
jgi:hypothetical protein